MPSSVSYLISNVDACLEALPKCLQPWGRGWLGNHLLQPIGEPGEHTTPHTAREGCESSWERHSRHPAPNKKQNPKQIMLHTEGCRSCTSQTQNLSPQRPQTPLSFPFLQWQQGRKKASSYHHSGSPQDARAGVGQAGKGALMCSLSQCGAYPQCVPGQQHPWGRWPFLLVPSGQKAEGVRE